jgi:cytochrome c-type biogenesis protein CcmH/NrfG
MLFVAMIALAAGFFVAVITVFFKVSSHLSDPTLEQPRKTSQGQASSYLSDLTLELPQQTSQGQASSAEPADQIFALENEVTLNPLNVEAWTQLGNWYLLETKEFEEAIEAYEMSLALNPDNPTVWLSLGVTYRLNSQPLKAVEAYDRAIQIDPRFEKALFNEGNVLLHDMNDREGAIRAWEELLKVNPAAMTPSGQSVKELIEKHRLDQNRQKTP